MLAVGTNSAATTAMLRAGADQAATGENAVVVGSRSADAIVGPVGIVIADAMLGEITPQMAVAVGQSQAGGVLIPVSQCDNIVAGAQASPWQSWCKAPWTRWNSWAPARSSKHPRKAGG